MNARLAKNILNEGNKMGYVHGYDPDEEEGRVIGKGSFGVEIREFDKNVIVGKDSMGEPITAHDLKPEVYRDRNGYPRKKTGLENF
jgi:hypothetical protein